MDQNMWARNAKDNQDRCVLWIVVHYQVPQLKLFVTYLDQRYKALTGRRHRDDEMVHAYSVLSSVFKSMLSANGDLFNVITNVPLTEPRRCRVIYDFSALVDRGKKCCDGWLVNVLAFAASALGEGDTDYPRC